MTRRKFPSSHWEFKTLSLDQDRLVEQEQGVDADSHCLDEILPLKSWTEKLTLKYPVLEWINDFPLLFSPFSLQQLLRPTLQR